MTATVLALLLADSRLPAGAHAHSGGAEQAVEEAEVRDVRSLAAWLAGRLATAVTVEAHAAALACDVASSTPDAVRAPARYAALDAELDARLPSPAVRRASRRQGEQYLRAAVAVVPGGAAGRAGEDPACGRRDPHLCVAVGIAAAAAGLAPRTAAAIVAYHGVSSPAGAALRLLGLDPLEVAATVAALAPACDALSERAAAAVAEGPGALPAHGAPALDRLAELHCRREDRLFAS